MIDWLTLRIPFKPEHVNFRQIDFSGEFPSYTISNVVPLSQLGIPLEVYFDSDGDRSGERHPWESIPSSFSGMAFKVFDFRDSLKEPLF